MAGNDELICQCRDDCRYCRSFAEYRVSWNGTALLACGPCSYHLGTEPERIEEGEDDRGAADAG